MGLEHREEFFGSSSLCALQAFAQTVEDGTIADLSLTVALRIIGRGE